MRVLLTVALLLAMSVPAVAKCDPAYAPYYHRQDVGPGSILADLFFLPFAIAIGTAGAPAAPVATPYGGAELSHHPICMAGHLARHAVEQRPVHAEHY